MTGSTSHMGHLPICLCGSYFVGHIVWITLCRSNCVGQIVWVILWESQCVDHNLFLKCVTFLWNVCYSVSFVCWWTRPIIEVGQLGQVLYGSWLCHSQKANCFFLWWNVICFQNQSYPSKTAKLLSQTENVFRPAKSLIIETRKISPAIKKRWMSQMKECECL